MLYILAIFCPPLAVLFTGKPFSALGNCFLWLAGVATFGIGWIVAFVHAVAVIHGAKQEKALRYRNITRP